MSELVTITVARKKFCLPKERNTVLKNSATVISRETAPCQERAQRTAINEAKKYLPDYVTMDVQTDGDVTTLTVNGKAAHASTPQVGKNSVTALIRVLGALNTTDETAAFFASLAKIFVYGECNGASLGIQAEDAKSGEHLRFQYDRL